MMTYCTLVRDGRADLRQRDVCCGNVQSTQKCRNGELNCQKQNGLATGVCFDCFVS